MYCHKKPVLHLKPREPRAVDGANGLQGNMKDLPLPRKIVPAAANGDLMRYKAQALPQRAVLLCRWRAIVAPANCTGCRTAHRNSDTLLQKAKTTTKLS